MSYSSVAACATDQALLARITSCVAQEQITRGEPIAPEGLARTQMNWAVATASDVEAAYESALAANHGDPGGDPSVITDQMILSPVQAHWPTPAGTVMPA